MKITLGITSSIAVEKAVDLIKLLKNKGHTITVITTKNVGIYDGQIDAIKEVADSYFSHELKYDLNEGVSHIQLAQESDAILIAPATFNFINKVATGVADDLLTTVMSAVSIDVFIAPAMNTFMWENTIVQASLTKLLKDDKFHLISPKVGMLACGYEGMGAMADISDIVDTFEYRTHLNKKVVITCGATRAYLDPIRFITNKSTGMMGHQLAQVYHRLGADVTCICANTNFMKIPGINYIDVDTVDDMYQAALESFDDADYFYMTAAVSDYVPVNYQENKIKKSDDVITVEFKKSVDILFELGQKKTTQTLIGFAAEDQNHLDNGRGKLNRKNLDYIIVNDLSAFNNNLNEVDIISKDDVYHIEQMSKNFVAKEIASYIK